MGKLKDSTVKRRIASYESKISSIKIHAKESIDNILATIKEVQERCNHSNTSFNYNDIWNGWDDHEDLKGYYVHKCEDCGKVLQGDILPSEIYRYK